MVMAVSLFFLSAGGSAFAAGGATALDVQASANEAAVVDRISDSFTAFAGSDDNALALVLGLRSGSEISLVTVDETTNTSTTTTFTPAAGPMGYGNVYIALGLAEASLDSLGLDSPTAADIEAALNGGIVTVGTGDTSTMVEISGVLALRADGAGWGKVAHELGVKLGPVMKKLNGDARCLAQLNKHARAGAR